MSIVLYRVDERLIHGQVVIGWGERLRPDRYRVVDDELAGSPWEQDLYRLAAGDAEAYFHTVEEARRHLGEWRGDESRTVLLTRDLRTMLRLARGGGLEGEGVNLGGIHHAEGRVRVASYLYLGPAERSAIRELEQEGLTVSGRDLPDAGAVGVDTLLGEG